MLEWFLIAMQAVQRTALSETEKEESAGTESVCGGGLGMVGGVCAHFDHIIQTNSRKSTKDC